jgi:hypothetical protein
MSTYLSVSVVGGESPRVFVVRKVIAHYYDLTPARPNGCQQGRPRHLIIYEVCSVYLEAQAYAIGILLSQEQDA